MPFPQPDPHPAYQSNSTDACHQAIQQLAHQTISSALSDRTSKLADDQVRLLTLLCVLIATVFHKWFPEETALLPCLRDETASFQTLTTVLQPVVSRQTLTLDAVFGTLIRLTPRQHLWHLGPLCWGVVGGEATMRPLLEGLGVARIDDILLIQAVLDGCLAALTEGQKTHNLEAPPLYDRSQT